MTLSRDFSHFLRNDVHGNLGPESLWGDALEPAAFGL